MVDITFLGRCEIASSYGSSKCMFSHVLLFVTPRTLACQAPLFMGLSRQVYWSGLSFPPLGYLPNPGIEPTSPALSGGFFTSSAVKNLLAMQELWQKPWILSLNWEDPLEKEMQSTSIFLPGKSHGQRSPASPESVGLPKSQAGLSD